MRPIASARPNNINVYVNGRRWSYYRVSTKDMTEDNEKRTDIEKKFLLIHLLGRIVVICKADKLPEFLKNLENGCDMRGRKI